MIKQLKSTLRTFLWMGSGLSTKGALVASDQVCLPKEGGLGMYMEQYMLKHLSLCRNPARPSLF